MPSEALGAGRAWILPLISETTSLLLSVITTVAIPWHCRYLSDRVFGAASNPSLTSRLMQFARLWISILAPALAVVLVHEDCFGGWVLLWPQCESRTIGFKNNYIGFCDWRRVTGAMPPGHCSRAVIEIVQRLLLSKLAYASFLLPSGVLLRLTPRWRRTKEAVVRRCKPTYRVGRLEIDSEFAALLMYMEYAVVFGLAIPPILPMLVIVLAVQCAVFHFAKEHLNLAIVNDHRPPLRYLWLSVLLGYLLLAWFFVDNDLHGTRLAVFGPPTLVLYMALYDQAKSSARAAQPIAAEYGTPLAAGDL